MELPIFSQVINIRSYESDLYHEATLTQIANYLQEAAGRHVIEMGLGISVADLIAKGLGWVLTRMQIQIFEMPQAYDTVQLDTFPTGFDKYYLYRDFLLKQAHSGAVCLQATSVWAVIDFAKRGIVPIPDFIKQMPLTAQPLMPSPKGKIPKIGQITHSRTFQVRWFDLDQNQHANNVQFLNWAIEALPEAWLRAYQAKQVDIAFRNEALYGDIIHSQVEVKHEQATSVHRLLKENQEEIAQVQIQWVARPMPK